jgi:parvulin-like peptidyl-prolyl isomerase
MLTGPEPAGTEPYGSRARWPARVVTILLAVAGLVWVVSVSANISDPAIPRIASRVARGESYDPALLRRMVTENLQSAQRLCNSKILRELLILQIGAAEGSVRDPDLRQADLDIANIDQMSKALLGCAPTESIGWLGVYWSNIRQEGFGPRAASYLAQSYRSAPHEAWIQLIRAPLALRSFEALSPELQEAAMQDFDDIFHAQLFSSAAMFLRAAVAPAQAKLLDRTCGYPENERQIFRNFVEATAMDIHHRCYDDRPSYMRDR